MQISVIGAGAIGGNLARLLREADHDVQVADVRGTDAVAAEVLEAGVRAVELDHSTSDQDVVILSIPFGKQPEVAELLSSAPEGAIVVDTANYYPTLNGNVEPIDNGTVETAWSQEQLGRPVVKAWNAALAETQRTKGRPSGAADRIAIPVAADSAEARRIVMQLVDSTGFDPVDAGTIAESWRQQPGTPAYCTELSIEELKHALAAAEKAKAPLTRDRLMQQFATLTTWPPLDEVVEINRAAH